ncbi:hypothetical protein TeGR_g11581 [Tetraparma gracilis]|uniref:Uncharacterized protein n=1 Tax=Tetraparma gracilis TaxID=2962635 RepID=A0ABQ6NAB0_9STRA|nr:hypothetical protein TeGR_g11581 [Tetraparma gracilis]
MEFVVARYWSSVSPVVCPGSPNSAECFDEFVARGGGGEKPASVRFLDVGRYRERRAAEGGAACPRELEAALCNGTLPELAVDDPDERFTYFDFMACDRTVVPTSGCGGIYRTEDGVDLFHALGRLLAEQTEGAKTGAVMQDLSSLFWFQGTKAVIHYFSAYAISLRELNGSSAPPQLDVSEWSAAGSLAGMNAKIESLPPFTVWAVWLNSAHGLGHGILRALIQRLKVIGGGGATGTREEVAKWAVGVLEGMSSIEMSKRLAQNFPSVSDRANFNQFAASGFYHELVNLHSDHVLDDAPYACLAESQGDCEVEGGGSRSRACAYEIGLRHSNRLSLEDVLVLNAKGRKVEDECSKQLNRAFYAAYVRASPPTSSEQPA